MPGAIADPTTRRFHQERRRRRGERIVRLELRGRVRNLGRHGAAVAGAVGRRRGRPGGSAARGEWRGLCAAECCGQGYPSAWFDGMWASGGRLEVDGCGWSFFFFKQKTACEI